MFFRARISTCCIKGSNNWMILYLWMSGVNQISCSTLTYVIVDICTLFSLTMNWMIMNSVLCHWKVNIYACSNLITQLLCRTARIIPNNIKYSSVWKRLLLLETCFLTNDKSFNILNTKSYFWYSILIKIYNVVLDQQCRLFIWVFFFFCYNLYMFLKLLIRHRLTAHLDILVLSHSQ